MSPFWVCFLSGEKEGKLEELSDHSPAFAGLGPAPPPPQDPGRLWAIPSYKGQPGGAWAGLGRNWHPPEWHSLDYVNDRPGGRQSWVGGTLWTLSRGSKWH